MNGFVSDRSEKRLREWIAPKLHKMGKSQRRVLLALASWSPAFSDVFLDLLREAGTPLHRLSPATWDAIWHGGRQLLEDQVDDIARQKMGVSVRRDRRAAIRSDRPDIPWARLFGNLPRGKEPTYSYAVRRLEEKRLLVRVRRGRNPRQTTHLRITPTGIIAAAELLRRSDQTYDN